MAQFGQFANYLAFTCTFSARSSSNCRAGPTMFASATCAEACLLPTAACGTSIRPTHSNISRMKLLFVLLESAFVCSTEAASFASRFPICGLIVNDYLSSQEPNASHVLISRLRMDQTLRGFLHPGSHHSQMFDCSSLVDLLRRGGFTDPRERTFRTSAIPNIESLEVASRKDESLYVEAQR